MCTRSTPVPFCALCISIDGLEKIRERLVKRRSTQHCTWWRNRWRSALPADDYLGRWLRQEFLAILTEL